MSDIDEVKSRLNIIDVIGSRVTLKKAGRNFKGLCPFHNEKTPSFMVSPERQTWHCFGCGKGGSAIDFVMETEHLTFVEALEDLAQKAGVKLTKRAADTPEDKLKEKMYEINHLASEYYQYVLTKHALGEKARVYLKTRGMTDKSIKTFCLGYSPNSWDALSNFLKKKGYDRELLEKSGLLISSPRGGYDRFRGRVMFTLRDHRGSVVGFSGRLLDPAIKEAKYINSPETPVYIKGNVLYGLDVTKSNIQKNGSAILMEGEFDVISSFQEGVGNAVAIKGSALTEGHIRILRRFTDKLIFALDSDLAGDAAARRGIELADRAGFELSVVSLPNGKDPDEAVRQNAKAVKEAIKSAVPVYDYFIASASRRYDPAAAEGKRRIGQELLPLIAAIENRIIQSHYIKKLAVLLNTTEDVIEAEMKKIDKRQGEAHQEKEEKPLPSQNRLETLEYYVLALLLQGKTVEFFEDFSEQKVAADISQPSVRRAIELLKDFLATRRIFLLKDFFDAVPGELTPVVDQACLWDIGFILENDEALYQEWNRAVRELRREQIKKKIHDLTTNPVIDPDRTDADLSDLTGELSLLDKQG